MDVMNQQDIARSDFEMSFEGIPNNPDYNTAQEPSQRG